MFYLRNHNHFLNESQQIYEKFVIALLQWWYGSCSPRFVFL